jgi:outer membrane protein, multidrug efflux system
VQLSRYFGVFDRTGVSIRSPTRFESRLKELELRPSFLVSAISAPMQQKMPLTSSAQSREPSGSRIYAGTVFWLAAVAVWGCAVGPNYRAPNFPVEPRWSEAPEHSSTAASQVSDGGWWLIFKDAEMTSLVERAIRANLDLRLAEARIHEARATERIQAAPLWPDLDATASFSRTLQSQNAFQSLGGSLPAGYSISNQATNLYQPGFDASWEIDVFGGTRRSVESAQASLKASIYDRSDVLLTLLGEVASDYIDLRLYQKQLEVTQNNLDAQNGTLKLTRDRLEGGLASELDVAQQESQVASTASEIPTLETSCRQSIHALGILLGEQPGSLSRELSSPAPIPAATPEIPLGLPSDLLRRRPDIRRDERKLAATVSNIGVATADLFPKFSLTGVSQFQSVSVSNLFSAGSLYWSFGPTVTWPILQGGQIVANIDKTNAQRDEALITYQQTVLNALEEVEDDIVAYGRERARYQDLLTAVSASRRALELSTELYLGGLKNFLDVLEAQRTLLSSENDLAASQAAVSKDFVALEKALGGGWQNFPYDPHRAQSSGG